jgi:hypothetical protein
VQAAKRATAVVLAVVGWVLVYLTAAHSWALLTARESVVGPAGLVASEVVRIAPALVYFLAIGLVMAHLFAASAGLRWAALTAAIAMALEALAEQRVFYGGIDGLAIAVLAVNYLLPIVAAMGGASIVRLWQKPKGGTVAT